MMTKESYRNSCYAVFAFSLSAFIFNTTEFVPVALLSDIALSFEMGTATVGLMITVYAWVVFFWLVAVDVLTAKVERKKLLLSIFALFIVSHILSVVRVEFLGIAHLSDRYCFGTRHFWSITASLVIRVAPKDKKTTGIGAVGIR